MIKRSVQMGLMSVLLVLLSVSGVSASTFQTADKISLPGSSQIEGNVYIGSQIAVLGSKIDGDAVVGSGETTLEGEINKDALIISGTILSKGKVSEDSRLLGGIITEGGTVGGDLVAIGGSVELQRTGVVGGDSLIVANQVTLDGKVAGNVTIIAQRVVVNGTVSKNLKVIAQEGLVIGQDAVIEGSLDYRSPKAAQIANPGSVRGETKFLPFNPGRVMTSISRGFFRVFGVSILIGTIMAGLLLTFLFSGKVTQILRTVEVNFWKKTGVGLLVVIFSPVVLIGLAITIIGGVVAMAGFLGLMIIMLMTHVLAGIFLGAWLEKVIRPLPELVVTWQNALAGIVVLAIISVVPFVGWIIKSLVFLAVLGALIQLVWNKGKEILSTKSNSRVEIV